MKLALVYDRLNKIGGAEEVLRTLHNLYPRAPLYSSTYSKKRLDLSGWDLRTSFLSSIPGLKNNHELIPFLMPFVFESFNFEGYDVVLSVSSAEAKGIITGTDTFHLNYCLTPTRYLWSHQDEYINAQQFILLRKLLSPLVKKITIGMQKWDRIASRRPDKMISISNHVKERVKKYYNIDSSVIYPPVDIQKFSSKSDFVPREKNYLLAVSRLVPYKHVEKLISVSLACHKTLVIVGIGSELKRLKKYARKIGAPCVFKEFVSDRELVGYYQNCSAFLHAAEEDFGIALVEAQAAGRPVVAYGVGGAAEIVIPGKTGVLVESQAVADFLRALDKLATIDVSETACRKNAARFGSSIFVKKIRSELNQICQRK